MKAITISREYGAGSDEVARKLGEILGWEVLDRSLLHQAAQIEQVPDAELEQFDEHAVSMADRFRLHPTHQKYLHGLTEAVRVAAERGNVILVGRGAKHLLGEMADVFHLRLVAPREWREARMARLEGWSAAEANDRCLDMDETRERFTRYFFGPAATQPAGYDLTVNTARVPLEDVAYLVATMVRQESVTLAPTAPGRRVLTLSRETGAVATTFVPALADRLNLQVYDRELLEREAIRLGVPEAELETIDEQPASIFQQHWPGSVYQRYLMALRQSMGQLADRGDVILVGRGGSCFLRNDARAFHVRLVAPLPVRVRRVMEERAVSENAAAELTAGTDAERGSFYESCFRVDWSSPLQYHLTVNCDRLARQAVDLISLAAERHWSGNG